jgi:2-polyprenyl-6-methoxyphenol hydroxylase-like FAD-dependent oxidoreductase
MMAANSHAVVIGGSMAGLMAARVLSNHFERVTIVERDKLPDMAEYRAGVPQARHLHVLLAHGREIIQGMFPNIHADLMAHGVPYIDLLNDGTMLTAGGWAKRFDSGLRTYLGSRVTLEFYVRQHLMRLANVTILPESDVESLVSDGGRVTGVKIVSRHDQSKQTLSADLVVDTSGRGSKVPEWLTEMGYAAPEETTVNAYLGYSTQWFEPPQNFDANWKMILITARPKAGITRGGGVFMVEGNRWIVTVAGVNKDYPPTDTEGFLEFTKTLASPAVYEAIRHATPVSQVYGYRRTDNRWRHYELLERFPERLGDSFCAFNPVYGQGMTVAAIEARELDSMLRENPSLDGLPTRFHKRLSKHIQKAWLLATGEDLRYPGTEGKRPGAFERLVQLYVDRVLETMPYDSEVTRAFVQTSNLYKPPTVLFHPRVVWSVIRHRFLNRVPADASANAPVSRFEPQVQGAD